MAGTDVYFGGIPVAPDVEKLFAAFAVPEPGTMITYREVEKTIDISRDRARFLTVTNAWRKKLFKEHNLVVEAIRNEGFLILSSKRRVRHIENKNKSIFRQARRNFVVASTTDTEDLDDIERKKLEIHARCARMTCEAFSREKRLKEENLAALPWNTEKD